MKLYITPIITVALLVGCGVKAPDISLFEAALAGDLDAVKQHIAAGTDLNLNDPNPSGNKDTALGMAAAFGKTDVATALIEGGADLDARNKDGSTPLHAASFLCYPEIVQALLDKGADKNARNNSGSTPLEGVELPWGIVKGIYELLDAILFKPLEAPLDYERIQTTRPKIVELLR
jgi:hypothetical protein